MIDNTTHTNDVAPEEMAQILARLQRGSAPSAPESGTEATTGTGMVARSVKMPKDLDQRVDIRARELGMSKSAYFRWLAEKDLKNAYSDEPEMVPLDQVREIATSAVDEALARMSHRSGHAA
ncbi:hypothetical protein ACFXPS_43455 [Nocardia sp. NPDC059091]|uniref:hypothetical protein n=1 Tax=unclassified Nocardia TaxID=2637762 RepID=UPI00368621CF